MTPDDLLPDLNLADDPVDSLTIPELRIANAKLRGDVVHAITTPTADRWDALALVAWLHAKRIDPATPLDRFTSLTAAQLSKVLAHDPPAPADQDGVAVAAAPATFADVVDAARLDPTVPTAAR